jgi:hypothetical protein
MLPPVQVRQTLEAARRAGVPFGVAWHAAVAEVVDERWAEALAQTSNTWRRAYVLEPASEGDVAIDMLSRGLADELASLDAQSHCVVCDAVIVSRGRRPRREQFYCSSRCRKTAANRRELLDVAA